MKYPMDRKTPISPGGMTQVIHIRERAPEKFQKRMQLKFLIITKEEQV